MHALQTSRFLDTSTPDSILEAAFPPVIRRTNASEAVDAVAESKAGSVKHGEFAGGFTDVAEWVIPEQEYKKGTVLYPGALRVPEHLLEDLEALSDEIAKNYMHSDKNYRLAYKNSTFRGHRQISAVGNIHFLRRFPDKPPSHHNLTGMPESIRALLCDERFGKGGGLVLIAGETGQGKNYTCTAVILERVQQYGLYCVTIEDPIEYDLQKIWPARNGKNGSIVQIPADRRSRSLASDLQDSLRCFPTGLQGTMLFIGEIDGPETATEVLHAADQGQLVFSTLHGTDPGAAIERLIEMAASHRGNNERGARETLSRQLRAVIHQRRVDEKLIVNALFSMEATSAVANKIKKAGTLATELEQQKRWIDNNQLIQNLLDNYR
jgi:twitching motility protein PilT